jgi:hypothetical protein
MGSPPRYQSQRPSTEQSTSPVMPVTRLRHPAVCPYSRPNVAVALTGHGGYSQGTVQNFVMGRCTIPLSPDRSPLRGLWGGTRPAQSHHHVCLNEPTSEPRRGSGRMAQGVNTRRPRCHSGTSCLQGLPRGARRARGPSSPGDGTLCVSRLTAGIRATIPSMKAHTQRARWAAPASTRRGRTCPEPWIRPTLPSVQAIGGCLHPPRTIAAARWCPTGTAFSGRKQRKGGSGQPEPDGELDDPGSVRRWPTSCRRSVLTRSLRVFTP